MTSRKKPPVQKAPAKRKPKKPTLSGMNRRLDTLARDICKLRADFTCQKCGIKGDSSSIEWAHIEARKRKAIRWAEENCLALCNSKINNCHGWFDFTRTSSVKWLIEAFPEKYQWLTTEIDGTIRAEATIVGAELGTIDGRLVLEAELKEVKNSLL